MSEMCQRLLLVRQDVPPMTVVGGVPAKILKKISPEEKGMQNETVL